jgi:putative peptidoglycan lipid II flippase
LVQPTLEPEAFVPPIVRRGRSVGIVVILTLIVSGFGYLREAALAARFGLSTTMDAYFGAIFIPYILYFVLIVGTLSPIFIPILLQDNADQDRAKASETFSVVTTFGLLMLLILVACGMIMAPKWLPLLFAGFDPSTLQVTVRLIYIIFPALLFLALSGILTATLNGFHRFALAAFAPALSSMAIIAVTFLARGDNAVYVVGLGTAAGFMLQGIFLVPAAAAVGLHYRPRLAFRHPAIKKLLRLGGPLLLYLVVANIASLLERNLASRLSAGAVSTLTYAQRLFLAPASFLAAPLAIVAYPQFASEALRQGRGNLAKQLSRILRLIVFLILPVAVWTILNALPITRVLYEHGRFVLADSLLTARVLAIYGFAIIPNAVAIILLRCFFAIEDTVTPLVAELIALVCFAVAAVLLARHFGIEGLAAARAMSLFVVTAILMLVLSGRRALLKLDLGLSGFLVRTVAAAIGMGAVNWMGLRLLQSAFDSGNTALRLGVICLLLIVSGAVYLTLARLLRLAEARQIWTTALDLIRGDRDRGQ